MECSSSQVCLYDQTDEFHALSEEVWISISAVVDFLYNQTDQVDTLGLYLSLYISSQNYHN